MNEAIRQMLSTYEIRTVGESLRPLREVMQEIALLWFAAHHPELHLSHLEQRMRQTRHWEGPASLTAEDLRDLVSKRIDKVDIDQIRHEVEPFVKDAATLAIWSKEFFLDGAFRIKIV